MPMVSASATPLDSWHMFEQSGRLFVPKRAGEQLVEERGLVAGAAARVEHRPVRDGSSRRCVGDQRERRRPR